MGVTEKRATCVFNAFLNWAELGFGTHRFVKMIGFSRFVFPINCFQQYRACCRLVTERNKKMGKLRRNNFLDN